MHFVFQSISVLFEIKMFLIDFSTKIKIKFFDFPFFFTHMSAFMCALILNGFINDVRNWTMHLISARWLCIIDGIARYGITFICKAIAFRCKSLLICLFESILKRYRSPLVWQYFNYKKLHLNVNSALISYFSAIFIWLALFVSCPWCSIHSVFVCFILFQNLFDFRCLSMRFFIFLLWAFDRFS